MLNNSSFLLTEDCKVACMNVASEMKQGEKFGLNLNRWYFQLFVDLFMYNIVICANWNGDRQPLLQK